LCDLNIWISGRLGRDRKVRQVQTTGA
jgi:hypothetical protein